MTRRGPIRVPDAEPEEPLPDLGEPTMVELPARAVIDAGVAKFNEMRNMHWPSRESGVSRSFDVTNDRQLRMVIGLTYMAMREAELGTTVESILDEFRDK